MLGGSSIRSQLRTPRSRHEDRLRKLEMPTERASLAQAPVGCRPVEPGGFSCGAPSPAESRPRPRSRRGSVLTALRECGATDGVSPSGAGECESHCPTSATVPWQLQLKWTSRRGTRSPTSTKSGPVSAPITMPVRRRISRGRARARCREPIARTDWESLVQTWTNSGVENRMDALRDRSGFLKY